MKIVFVILDYDGSPVETARKRRMQASWAALQGVEIVRPNKFKRSSLDLGDPREMFYVKDIIEAGLKKAKGDDDVIAWINDDVWIHPALPQQLASHCARFGVCTAHRVDYETYERHPGRDLFAATVRWWKQYWDEVPDGILGAPAFDLHMASLIRLQFGIRTNLTNMIEVLPPAELPRGFFRHQNHIPAWSTGALIMSPAAVHNRTLFKTWANKNLPELVFNNKDELVSQ